MKPTQQLWAKSMTIFSNLFSSTATVCIMTLLLAACGGGSDSTGPVENDRSLEDLLGTPDGGDGGNGGGAAPSTVNTEIDGFWYINETVTTNDGRSSSQAFALVIVPDSNNDFQVTVENCRGDISTATIVAGVDGAADQLQVDDIAIPLNINSSISMTGSADFQLNGSIQSTRSVTASRDNIGEQFDEGSFEAAINGSGGILDDGVCLDLSYRLAEEKGANGVDIFINTTNPIFDSVPGCNQASVNVSANISLPDVIPGIYTVGEDLLTGDVTLNVQSNPVCLLLPSTVTAELGSTIELSILTDTELLASGTLLSTVFSITNTITFDADLIVPNTLEP